MKVLFTDGSMNAMGMNPATYTTDSLMVQHAIENSDHFKRGRIHIVRTVPLDEDVHIDRNPKREEAPAPVSTPAPEKCVGVENTEVAESAEADNVESQAEEAPAPVSTPMEMTKEITEMEFDNNDDARDFLETKFGYVRSKLRNRADIVAAGEAHNIAISFS